MRLLLWLGAVCGTLRYLDNDCIRVVFADRHDEQDALLQQRFDHIFFTGSPRVGKIVMEAAAKFLTPVTLELGGKSPAVVDKSAALGVSVRRLIWGKLQNVGQTCIAPDYALVHESIVPEFIKLSIECIKEFYGEDPRSSQDYGRLIDVKHYDKLEKLLEDDSQYSLAYGGQRDRESRFFAPTLLTDVKLDSPLMKSEIFGPILPIIPFSSANDVVAFLNQRPRALALYCFAQDDDFYNQILMQTTSGGSCINETFMHVAVNALPFGGVGESGMGRYHGKYSFDTFSHRKSLLHKATFVDPPVGQSRGRVWVDVICLNRARLYGDGSIRTAV